MTVHRQVIARVIDATSSAPSKGEAVGKAVAEVALNPEKESGKLAIDPQFGERVQKPAAKAKPSTKSSQSGSGESGSDSNK
jgi:hypothetical protein